jgi:predicted unusual protein kinase regulating ubiquinone biosynthesis (AarF/ABC1/UbiB family)
MSTGKRRRQRWSASARVAVRRLLARVRVVLTTEPGSRGADVAELAEARERARGASELKGGVVKVAQLEGYFYGPGAALDAGARAELAWLWDALPPMSAEAARQVVIDDLGRPPEELFASWEEEPLAAASLGQVHAAVGRDGAPYAVKVQYPKAADALRADLESSRVARQLAGAETGSTLGADAVETLRTAVLRELDYEAEAEAQLAFRDAYRDDDAIVIPDVNRELSSARVLTMERVAGRRLFDVATGAGPELRAAVAGIIFRFAWGAPLTKGLLNGDPNPGNYLLLPGDRPRVAFLDYGCAATMDGETAATERRLWRALLHRDPFEAAERFRIALQELGMIGEGSTIFGNLYREWERLLLLPFGKPGEFAWTSRFAYDFTETTSRLLWFCSGASDWAWPPYSAISTPALTSALSSRDSSTPGPGTELDRRAMAAVRPPLLPVGSYGHAQSIGLEWPFDVDRHVTRRTAQEGDESGKRVTASS